MPTTPLPARKEKAHEVAQKITNERPLRKDPHAPDANVTGGFNQKRDADDTPAEETGAARGDGQ
jgi:hypothetical protein